MVISFQPLPPLTSPDGSFTVCHCSPFWQIAKALKGRPLFDMRKVYLSNMKALDSVDQEDVIRFFQGKYFLYNGCYSNYQVDPVRVAEYLDLNWCLAKLKGERVNFCHLDNSNGQIMQK